VTLGTILLLVLVVAALLVNYYFLRDAWQPVRLSADYLTGTIVGIGLGLVLCPAVTDWLGVGPRVLPWLAAGIIVAGNSIRSVMQKRALQLGN